MDSWHDRAIKVIPGGAQTYSKSADYYPRPFFATRGLGCKLVTDEDTIHMNKEYLDMVMGLGSVILGYKSKQWFYDLDFPEGINFSVPHPLEVQVAERLLGYFPHHDMVKFFKNGSDATEIAVRLARAYTGNDIILCCNYHGFHDWYISSQQPSLGILEVNKLYNWNTNELDDVPYALQACINNKSRIAGIIIEPSHPQIKKISKLARETNIVLIFDEVLTGFRHGIGGLQSVIGIEPDITCLGKCMANGLPLSAVVGKSKIMKLMNEGVFASSTMGGETLSLSACLQTIKELEESNNRLEDIGLIWYTKAKDLLRLNTDLIGILDIIGRPQRCGFTFKDDKWKSLYMQELLDRGILTNGINNFCLAHTEKDIDDYLIALEEVFGVMKKAKEEGIEKYLRWQIRPAFKR